VAGTNSAKRSLRYNFVDKMYYSEILGIADCFLFVVIFCLIMFRFLCKKGVTSYQMNPKSVIVKKVTYSVRLPLCGDDDKYFHNVKVMMVNSTTVIKSSQVMFAL